jgi:hypothetical protein
LLSSGDYFALRDIIAAALRCRIFVRRTYREIMGTLK